MLLANHAPFHYLGTAHGGWWQHQNPNRQTDFVPESPETVTKVFPIPGTHRFVYIYDS